MSSKCLCNTRCSAILRRRWSWWVRFYKVGLLRPGLIGMLLHLPRPHALDVLADSRDLLRVPRPSLHAVGVEASRGAAMHAQRPLPEGRKGGVCCGWSPVLR